MKQRTLEIIVDDQSWMIEPDAEVCSGADFIAYDFLVKGLQSYSPIKIHEADSNGLLYTIPWQNLKTISAFDLEKIIRGIGGYPMPQVIDLDQVAEMFPAYAERTKGVRQSDDYGFTGEIHKMAPDANGELTATHYVIYPVEGYREYFIERMRLEVDDMDVAEGVWLQRDAFDIFVEHVQHAFTERFKARGFKELTQRELSDVLGICDRSFRRYSKGERYCSHNFHLACYKMEKLLEMINRV